MSETPAGTGMGPDEPVGSKRSGHRSRTMILAGVNLTGSILPMIIGAVNNVRMNEPRQNDDKELTDSDLESVIGATGLGGGCEPITQNSYTSSSCRE